MDESLKHQSLKRRNSIPSAVLIPRRLKSSPPILHSNGNGNHYHKLPGVDFELVSLKSPGSYTSLKDIMPCSPSSMLSPAPTPTMGGPTVSSASSGSGYEISIRNRLVKQAAWAYLQPAVSSSPSSSTRRLFFSGEFFRPIMERSKRFVSEAVTRVYDWLADVLWLILCR